MRPVLIRNTKEFACRRPCNAVVAAHTPRAHAHTHTHTSHVLASSAFVRAEVRARGERPGLLQDRHHERPGAPPPRARCAGWWRRRCRSSRRRCRTRRAPARAELVATAHTSRRTTSGRCAGPLRPQEAAHWPRWVATPTGCGLGAQRLLHVPRHPQREPVRRVRPQVLRRTRGARRGPAAARLPGRGRRAGAQRRRLARLRRRLEWTWEARRKGRRAVRRGGGGRYRLPKKNCTLLFLWPG